MSIGRTQNLLDIKSKVALETGFTERQISQVIHCFYDDWIRILLSEFRCSIVLIEHLGSFTYRKAKYEGTVKFITKELKKYRYNISHSGEKVKPEILSLWEGKVL